MILPPPALRARILTEVDRIVAEGGDSARVSAMRRRFLDRFPPERLALLQGTELLEELHGRGRDSVAYWLERKSDEAFDTLWFGSIRGGSALKFVVFQGTDDAWYTGHANDVQAIPKGAAAAIAERQRDQLLAALAVVHALPPDPSAAPWLALQQRIAEVAPDCHQLAFFHKLLSLYEPDRLDDFHAVPYQIAALVGAGMDAEDQGLWANARRFVALLEHLREARPGLPMCTLTGAMHKVGGGPFATWRVGSGNEQHDPWPEMLEQEVVAIGWNELGDLGDVVGGRKGHEGIAALRDAVQRAWPNTSPQAAGRDAQQLWRFFAKMTVGDRVVVAKGQHVRGIAEIVGDYFFAADRPYGHRRRVRWLSVEPFHTQHKDGLQTTVYPLDKALELRADLARQLAGRELPTRPLSLPSPTVLAILDQLERKGQVILYGPPGTGKTWHAVQAAEELVARSRHARAWAELPPAEREAIRGAGPDQQIWACTFHPAYGYEDFVEGLRPVPVPGGLSFSPQPGLFRRICQRAAEAKEQPFVLVIDEFNRGDAPRIFGELLTLLERDKRERMQVVLPHSGAAFTVPRNVYILATMNTADRSIALLDAALRRRFGFIELLPDAGALGSASAEGISLAGLLRTLNRRLVAELGDRARDLQVGHSYFMTDQAGTASFTALRSALRYDVLPLLQEYCADDPRALGRIVGEALYDAAARTFRWGVFMPGAEAQLVAALLAWDPEVAAVAEAADPSDDA